MIITNNLKLNSFLFPQDGILPSHYAIYPAGGLHFAGAERVRAKLIALRNSMRSQRPPTLETLRGIPDNAPHANVANDTNLETHVVVNGTNVAAGTRYRTNLSNSVRKSNVLVIYCDGLYRMDYTFLQVCVLLFSRIISTRNFSLGQKSF